MTLFRSANSPRALIIAAGALLAAACTEPRRVDNGVRVSPAAPLQARVELSDSSAAPGSTILVTLRLAGPSVASATARLSYDTTGVAFVSEQSIDDGATRVINPAAGAMRIAAIAPRGFTDGRLEALTFTVRRGSALSSFRFTVDEAHTLGGADAVAATLSRNP